MFRRTSVTHNEALTQDQPKAQSFWGFLRRATVNQAIPGPDEETAFTVDDIAEGFEAFGRTGLELGGLHRDHQCVGAWGGRC